MAVSSFVCTFSLCSRYIYIHNIFNQTPITGHLAHFLSNCKQCHSKHPSTSSLPSLYAKFRRLNLQKWKFLNQAGEWVRQSAYHDHGMMTCVSCTLHCPKRHSLSFVGKMEKFSVSSPVDGTQSSFILTKIPPKFSAFPACQYTCTNKAMIASHTNAPVSFHLSHVCIVLVPGR